MAANNAATPKIPTRRPPRTAKEHIMNAIQAITAAATLQALCDALNAYRPEDHDGRALEESIALDDLPVFGSNEPTDTLRIWSWNDTHFLVQAAGEGFELKAREISYWVRQADGTCTHQSGEPCATLAEAEHDMEELQKKLGWTGLEIIRAEEINGNIYEKTVGWGRDAGDLCVGVDVSETQIISIPGAAETEDWREVRALADKVEFVESLGGWDEWTSHYMVWFDGNPNPLHYFVVEAETEVDE